MGRIDSTTTKVDMHNNQTEKITEDLDFQDSVLVIFNSNCRIY